MVIPGEAQFIKALKLFLIINIVLKLEYFILCWNCVTHILIARAGSGTLMWIWGALLGFQGPFLLAPCCRRLVANREKEWQPPAYPLSQS